LDRKIKGRGRVEDEEENGKFVGRGFFDYVF